MRYAPSYSADRFPGDFSASALAGLIAAVTLGPAAWWLSRQYMQRTYPGHPELLQAAVVAGVFDGFVVAVLAFAACLAVRIWSYERRERQRSDELLRTALSDLESRGTVPQSKMDRPPRP